MKAVELNDAETIASCDRALVACGGRVEKKLVTTSNTQIAVSYAVFLCMVWSLKNPQHFAEKAINRIESAVGGDAGLTLAFTMALASGVGISLMTVAATLFRK